MTPHATTGAVFLFLMTFGCVAAANAQQGPSQVDGQWVMTTDVFGNALHQTLTLKVEGDKLTGSTYDGDRTEISGTLSGDTIHFTTKEEGGGTPSEYEGTVSGNQISGTARVFGSRPEERYPVKWTARRMAPLPGGPPQRHEFVPKVFHRAFSAYNEPVLHVKSGDSVHTTTVDAGGFDEKSVPRVLGGNPQTGPFFVDGAMPGDTLLVKLLRVRLNRDWASSDDALVGRALSANAARQMRYEPKAIRWKLDRELGLAMPAEPSEHLKNYRVPVRPMLGCVATAPGFASQPVPTGDSGGWGGNMDFNELGEGVTVHLPVNQPGALLYVGDGHALQGDGELNGNALETSMDVEFTVELIKEKSINGPRVENADYIMTVGLAGSVDDALKQATGAMGQWITAEYQLTPSETAQFLGTAIEYRIAEVADRNAGVVAKIRKERLAGLK